MLDDSLIVVEQPLGGCNTGLESHFQGSNFLVGPKPWTSVAGDALRSTNSDRPGRRQKTALH